MRESKKALAEIVARGGVCIVSAAGALAIVPQDGELLVIQATDVPEVLEYAAEHTQQPVQAHILQPHLTAADALQAFHRWAPDFTIVRSSANPTMRVPD